MFLLIALLLGNLRMPYKNVRDLVLSVDDRITEQMLEQLLKFMPKKEEVSLCKITFTIFYYILLCYAKL